MTATARTPYWPDSTTSDGDWLASPDDDGNRRPSFPAHYLAPDPDDIIGAETGPEAPTPVTNGGTPSHLLPDWRIGLGHSETRPVRSSSGRRTFEVTRRHLPHAVHLTDDAMAADVEQVRLSSLDLIAQADALMSDHAETCDGCDACGWHDEECAEHETGCSGRCGHAPVRMLGTDGGRAYGQMLRTGRSDDPYRVAVHHSHVGDVLTASLTPRDRANLSDRYRDHDKDPVRGSKLTWPMRTSVRIGAQRFRGSETPEPVTLTDGSLIGYARETHLSGEWPAVVTLSVLPAWADSTARVHVGTRTVDRPMTRDERVAARKRDQASAQTVVNVPLAHAEDVASLWTALAPGTAVSGNVAGHTLTLSQGMSGQVRVTYNGSTWKARTARAVAARIA